LKVTKKTLSVRYRASSQMARISYNRKIGLIIKVK